MKYEGILRKEIDYQCKKMKKKKNISILNEMTNYFYIKIKKNILILIIL